MPSFSFDVVSDYDKAETNNVYASAQRKLSNRFDFKGTPAAIEWLDNKGGVKLIGQNQWQCEAILDIFRKELASRNQSVKILDLSKSPTENNLKTTWEIPFKHGLTQDDAKKISKLLRDQNFKVKSQIQNDTIRVTGSSKDELQKVITFLQATDFAFPLQFINYR